MIADGIRSYNIDSDGYDYVAPLLSDLEKKEIKTLGWHYIYGLSPSLEAEKAFQRVRETGVRGYIIDAKAEFKQPGKEIVARTFMHDLRESLPNLSIGLSTYRHPSIHS